MKKKKTSDFPRECLCVLPEDLVCLRCGFMTHNPFDLIQHLACVQPVEEEDCVEKVVDIK